SPPAVRISRWRGGGRRRRIRPVAARPGLPQAMRRRSPPDGGGPQTGDIRAGGGEALRADLPPGALGLVAALGPGREQRQFPGNEDLAAALRLAAFGRGAKGEGRCTVWRLTPTTCALSV